MLHIYLVRHGEKENTKQNPGLTTKGIEQTKKTAQYLSRYPITHVFASPFLRAQQTAKHIAQYLNLTVVIDERLCERMDFQEFDGDRTEFFTEWLKATHDRSYIPKSGRSSHQTANEVLELIEEIDNKQFEHVVLVTHGGSIADVLRTMLTEEQLKPLKHHFTEGEDYRIDECSVTIIEKDSGSFRLKDLHCCSHL